MRFVIWVWCLIFLFLIDVNCSMDLLRQGVGALQDSVRHLLQQQNVSWSNIDSLPWKT